MTATNDFANNVGLVLLAAGASTRLGRPKQLLHYRGQTLLKYSLQAAITSGVKPVVVVLGANADRVQKEIKEANVQVVINDAWEEGMASSIRCGINAVTRLSPINEGIILMVCDQPYVTPILLNELLTAHQKTGKKIIACSYADTFGPPVFFHRSLFEELLQLKGDVGAKSIVKQHGNLAETIPFPEGRFDLDTEADYETLNAMKG